MSKIEAIIYDVDGTMINSEPIHVEAWSRALALHDRSMADLSEVFRNTMAGKKPIVIAQGMIDELSLQTSAEQLLREKSAPFFAASEGNLHEMPGAKDSIVRLAHAGYRLGIGTSLDRDFLYRLLSELDVINYFDVTITGDQIKNGKPDPETYLRAIEKLGVHPQNCLILEDAETGILAAKAAGAWCIAILNRDAVPQDTSKADKTVLSMDEVSEELIESFGAK